jgi:hypothetical protein
MLNVSHSGLKRSALGIDGKRAAARQEHWIEVALRPGGLPILQRVQGERTVGIER